MCISIPARVIAVEGKEAIVEVVGKTRCVKMPTVQAAPDDWVLIYSGIVLAKMEPAAAEETLSLLAKMTIPSAT